VALPSPLLRSPFLADRTSPLIGMCGQARRTDRPDLRASDADRQEARHRSRSADLARRPPTSPITQRDSDSSMVWCQIADLVRLRHGTARVADQMQIRRLCACEPLAPSRQEPMCCARPAWIVMRSNGALLVFLACGMSVPRHVNRPVAIESGPFMSPCHPSRLERHDGHHARQPDQHER
jgi:hypothetical protein